MEKWQDNLPDEMKVNPTLAKYDTQEAAMQGLIEATGRLGRSITIPDEEADEETKGKFYEKVRASAPNLTIHPDFGDEENATEFWRMAGVPADKKGYVVVEGFEGLPKEYVDNIREVAATAGWTVKQFQATLKEFATEHANNTIASDEAAAADAAVVSGKWGAAEEQRKSGVAALIEQFQDPNNKLGELNAAAYLLLDNIVKAFSGKGPQAKFQPVGGDMLSPEEIEDKLSMYNNQLLKGGRAMPRDEYKRIMNKKERLLKMRAAA